MEEIPFDYLRKIRQPYFAARMRYACSFLFLVSSLQLQAQVLPSFGNSRTGTAGMQFLKIYPDARSAAMGGAFVAVANDATALYWNNAGIVSSEKKYQVGLGVGNYFAGSKISQFSLIYKKKTSKYWGLMVNSIDFGQMQETTEFQPVGTGRTFSLNCLTVGISYAQELTDHFSYGVMAKWAYEGIASVATNNLLFDLGFKYNVGVKNARFAVALSNYGANVKPNGKLEVLKFNGQNEITEFQRVSVPSIFRLGAAFDPISKGYNVLTLSGQLNHYTDNNETFSLGAEYTWKKLLIFRSGYEFGADEGGLPGLGFGLNMLKRIGCIRLDYSFNNKARLGNLHRIGLVYTPK